MAFNMGEVRLSKFVKFKSALENYDFSNAVKEMKNSKWYSQVKNRGERLVSIISQQPPSSLVMTSTPKLPSTI
jgi:hypothetical protein